MQTTQSQHAAESRAERPTVCIAVDEAPARDSAACLENGTGPVSKTGHEMAISGAIPRAPIQTGEAGRDNRYSRAIGAALSAPGERPGLTIQSDAVADLLDAVARLIRTQASSVAPLPTGASLTLPGSGQAVGSSVDNGVVPSRRVGVQQ